MTHTGKGRGESTEEAEWNGKQGKGSGEGTHEKDG